MPKRYGTRKQRAQELVDRLRRGPSFARPFDAESFTPEMAADLYRLWSQSWILSEVTDLLAKDLADKPQRSIEVASRLTARTNLKAAIRARYGKDAKLVVETNAFYVEDSGGNVLDGPHTTERDLYLATTGETK